MRRYAHGAATRMAPLRQVARDREDVAELLDSPKDPRQLAH
jgi:hypothetical protein